MFNKLSFSQKRIVVCNEPRIVIKACPGSGKTFSVTARLARLLKCNNLNKHEGIAALSFTNTAANEIKNSLKENYQLKDIDNPHFIGTIDSFINKYIFLPFGHLEMKCKTRPEIVGTEYNKWFEYNPSQTKYFKHKVTYRDPNYYFEMVSFKDVGNDRIPIPLRPPSSYHFSWDKIKNQDGSYNKKVNDIILSKEFHFKQGKAVQADANYFALRILKKYPQIAKDIALRFPILIIDEAQDTTEIQMSIIDLLDSYGLKSIMLIGDPDQAIFEWNTANAELFNEKWNSSNWFQLALIENRRSSTKICEYLNCFFNGNMISIGDNKDCPENPKIIGYEPEVDSVFDFCDSFMDKCNTMSISEDNLAIVYRGRSFGEKHFGFVNTNLMNQESPWKNNHYYLRDIIQGKFLIEKGNLKLGFKQIEKGYHKYKNGIPFVSSGFLREKINESSFREYRNELFQFIHSLPEISDKNLGTWVNEASSKFNFEYKLRFSNLKIDSLFHDESKADDYSFINTIHSVKGKSLDAILIFLVKKDNSNYTTLLRKDFNTLSIANKEQMRIVYVACSRPRKLLWLVVPNDDVVAWKRYFNIS